MSTSGDDVSSVSIAEGIRTVTCKGNSATSPRTHKPNGFSLLEILIVLAVFVAITAIAVPTLNRSHTNQQLRSGADIVRGNFGRARIRAIETGDVYAFYFSPGSNQYHVSPMSWGFQSIESGITPQVFIETLDNELVFAAGESTSDARSQATEETAILDTGTMQTVLFYPDGTSQDATIIIQSPIGATIQVHLRGLTGQAGVSVVMAGEENLQ